MEYFNATLAEIKRLERELNSGELSYGESMRKHERCISLYRDLYSYDREEYCKRFNVEA